MKKQRKAIVRAEIVEPVRIDPTSQLERLIEAKVAEALDKNTGDAIFEPFFRSKEESNQIIKKQTVPQQMKFTLYFAKWGCMVCERTDALHDALGMCQRCYQNRRDRLRKILKEAEKEQKARGIPVFRDMVVEAQQALSGAAESRRALREKGD